MDDVGSDIQEYSPSKLLTEVSSWKLEAKFEDNERYFYSIKEENFLLSGQKSFVIGRKGSGKTALSERILQFEIKNIGNFLSEKLSFKNFPFNELYKLSNESYTKPNQYITIWKYVIYSTYCRMLVRDSSVAEAVKADVRAVYGTDSKPSLKRLIPQWVSKDFSVDILGVGVNYGREIMDVQAASWIDKVNVLEDFILKKQSGGKYFIVFDELDEDYKDFLNYNNIDNYLDLITSLFKAVQDIRYNIGDSVNLFPIVFLRDDIYELIKDSDKTKWNDFRIYLDWSKQQIKNLVAFRLSRALDARGPLRSFDEMWEALFGIGQIGVGKGDRNRINSFDFISRSTHLRPRDFISYLKFAADEAISRQQSFADQWIVKAADKEFSNYLRSELEDEMFAVVPDVKDIFECISQLRKQIFTVDELRSALRKHRGARNERLPNEDLVLRFLFHFSVVGNYNSKSQQSFFRFNNKEARINFSERLIVHRGLFKSLQIGAGIANYND